MARMLVLLLVILCAIAAAPSASAAPISSRNPYRSFNISGVNYGSVRWEQAHRGRVSHRHVGGLLLRRR